MYTATLESALENSEVMVSKYDKGLFITLYGSLISSRYKERVQENEDVEVIFTELCFELKKMKNKA